MDHKKIFDINIDGTTALPTPEQLMKDYPLSKEAAQGINENRQVLKNILSGKDKRLMIVVGPCSIHDPKSAIEYAKNLSSFAQDVSDSLFIIMRVYFEKPRTTIGWKGLLNDPFLDDSCQVKQGLCIGRELLVQLAEMGLPLGTEALDPLSPQFFQDTISWSAIGARTAESQTHRELASGLSGTIGFKNGTDGGIEIATAALRSAAAPHKFLGIDSKGKVCVVNTKGNQSAHIVLRGGRERENYDSVSVSICEKQLEDAGLKKNIMIDCSHANSQKNFDRQPLVLQDIATQIMQGSQSICGVMIESHLKEGNQKVPQDLRQLQYGVSITDACLSWEDTKKILLHFRSQVKPYLKNRR